MDGLRQYLLSLDFTSEASYLQEVSPQKGNVQRRRTDDEVPPQA